nr:MAG TPA: hypothetical protein [Caudoviricetes sp.]
MPFRADSSAASSPGSFPAANGTTTSSGNCRIRSTCCRTKTRRFSRRTSCCVGRTSTSRPTRKRCSCASTD